ncbi:MAG: protein kinase domain-containing protein [Acidobacteriota bacterium]
MPLSPGVRLGPYEILTPVGAGGMGEVYKARDTRLERTVAVKVLPAHLSSSSEVRQRFEREAKTISQLSHSHICALYDVGEEGDTEYLVMEYLEGETLTDRLGRGALPTEQVLRFGQEIADALDKAHRQGIVHRDLKPGNVMLTKSGVKLLDFGLAKAVAPVQAQSVLTALPTMGAAAQNLTEAGTILGTFQYMAPEQLEGKEADARSDIFAFGAVLYEMATGRKAFEGKSQASLIASILEHEPPSISSVSPLAPPALDRVVKTCLAKDAEDRWQTAHDLKAELKWIADVGSQAGVPAPVVAKRKNRERIAWGLVAALAAIAALAVAGFLARAPKPAPVIRSSLVTPAKQFVSFLALSPDGTRLVFAANSVGAQPTLWVRRLDGSQAEPIAGTEEASFPFWSPDGLSIAFFADKKLKKVDLSGGPVITICEAERGVGGTWAADGTILFAPTPSSPIFRVPSSGGKPVPVTKFDEKRHETTHRYPHFLPDGRHFLYAAANLAGSGDDPANAIRLWSLDGGENRAIVPGLRNACYSGGHLFYAREGTLFAQPFNAKRLSLQGEAVPVAQKVAAFPQFLNFTPIGVTGGGLLVFEPDVAIASRLIWFDRGGKELGAVGEADLYGNMRLSPDGKKLAVGIVDPRRSRSEIWLVDFTTGARTKLVSGDAQNSDPVWSPDGDRIAFDSDRRTKGGNADIWVKSINGGTEELLFESSDSRTPEDWSRDGRYLSFSAMPAIGKRNVQIWLAELSAARKATPFQTKALYQYDSRISPDGRWLAFGSDESGRSEVYVIPFPSGRGRWQISAAGGAYPRWRRDGRELFFLSTDNQIQSVSVTADSVFHAASPVPLFAVHGNPGTDVFEVSADGQRFLVNSLPEDLGSPPLTLVVNWPATLRKKTRDIP